MSRYNKAVGSGLGGLIGLFLGIVIVAGLNYAKVEITPDIHAQVDSNVVILTSIIMSVVGTYLAPKNSE